MAQVVPPLPQSGPSSTIPNHNWVHIQAPGTQTRYSPTVIIRSHPFNEYFYNIISIIILFPNLSAQKLFVVASMPCIFIHIGLKGIWVNLVCVSMHSHFRLFRPPVSKYFANLCEYVCEWVTGTLVATHSVWSLLMGSRCGDDVGER